MLTMLQSWRRATLNLKLPEAVVLHPYRRVCARCMHTSSVVTVAAGQVYVIDFFRPQPCTRVIHVSSAVTGSTTAAKEWGSRFA